MTSDGQGVPRLVRDFPPLFYLETVASTNSSLKEWARTGPLVPGTGLYAGNQIGGRGRRGNRWLHVPGNLVLSIWVPEQTFLLPPWTLRLAWTVLSYLEKKTVRCRLKYPNDIHLSANSLKLSGILVEQVSGGAVLGVGLNRFLPESLSKASACEDLPDHHEMALSLSELFFSSFLSTEKNVVTSQRIMEDLNRSLLWKGEWVVWKEDGPSPTGLGKIVGLDLSGRLEILDATGNSRKLPETVRSVERVEPPERASRW
ncbi:MAG: hypothetical protein M1297_00975 [Nitrospirae bacterium]|jgi:BirA family biotin operon repressor/biotin-[acetyl-CoA-carboxylase] ligase|nr:hypothetical protein [Nitrospirota bacterium]